LADEVRLVAVLARLTVWVGAVAVPTLKLVSPL
jgi:hypothetical protein